MARKPTKAEIEERDAARGALRELFPIGSQVSIILRHVSRSGMLRVISVLSANDDGTVDDVSWMVNKAGIGGGFDRDRGGIKMGGCGMDMGFALVYDMGRVLYPDGFKSGENGSLRRNGAKEGAHDPDGGYALRHRWL